MGEVSSLPDSCSDSRRGEEPKTQGPAGLREPLSELHGVNERQLTEHGPPASLWSQGTVLKAPGPGGSPLVTR